MDTLNKLSITQWQTIQVEPLQRSKTSDVNSVTQGQAVEQQSLKTEKQQFSSEVVDSYSTNAFQADNTVEQISEDKERLTRLMDELNNKIEESKSYLRFEWADNYDQLVITIKDSNTEEVIRQIPSNEFLAISQNITQFLEMQQKPSSKAAMPSGLFANETA